MIAFPHILNGESKAKQSHWLKVSQLMQIELGFYQTAYFQSLRLILF